MEEKDVEGVRVRGMREGVVASVAKTRDVGGAFRLDEGALDSERVTMSLSHNSLHVLDKFIFFFFLYKTIINSKKMNPFPETHPLNSLFMTQGELVC